MTQPSHYYLAQDVRELDRLAIEVHGIPGFTLMQRAGKAALDAALEKWPELTAVCCFCGSGNNGGDGYIIASLAAALGLEATVIPVGDSVKLKGDARLALEMAIKKNIPMPSWELYVNNPAAYSQKGTLLVDAMLGTGLTGKVKGQYLEAIQFINASTCPVLAADIPSGLCSDTGEILGEAVRADLTVTFIGRKLGQVKNQGKECCGELVFNDLGVPGEIYQLVSPATP